VARLVDFALVAVVSSVLVSGVLVSGVLGMNAALLGGWGTGTGSTFAANAVANLGTTLLTLGYFVATEAATGQTLGKRLLRLETRGPAGGRPTVEQALRRNAFTAIALLGMVPFLGLAASLLSLVAVVTIAVTINNDATHRRGWHDRFAGGTTVVTLRGGGS
jgi:hypothetical protein